MSFWQKPSWGAVWLQRPSSIVCLLIKGCSATCLVVCVTGAAVLRVGS